MNRDWAALARIVRERREALHLRQADVEGRGGPGIGTVRNIELGSRTSYSPRTLARLERALSWSDGAVERILDGRATAQDLNPNCRFVRAGVARLNLVAEDAR